ncbi:MAG: WecB/TagA/CpsF family glycosyltransferase [Opitutaceae bacterium]|nr:WecB/TagA/CpsF family glycosyltransferase [Opitutaceae bacterium]
MSPTRHNILGTLISAVDYAQATAAIIEEAKSRTAFAASALAVHALGEARANPDYQRKLNALDLATPDGQPVRWALNWLHHAGLRDRVYGPFLMRDVCHAAARENLPVFLFGSTERTLAKLTETLNMWDPRLIIAGTQPSRFRRISAEEAAGDAATIIASGARIVFCGLGCPRQEHWAHAMKPLLPMPTIAVGAAFALWAGEKSMAPAWMQRGGLEWIYRFSQEPSRLWHRYLVHNPRFALGVLAQKIRKEQRPADVQPAEPEYWG